jgi:hypothetical protein
MFLRGRPDYASEQAFVNSCFSAVGPVKKSLSTDAPVGALGSGLERTSPSSAHRTHSVIRSRGRAAEVVQTHQATARYRLGKIEERTSCDLRRIAVVLDLLIAIQIEQSRPIL